jgi:hypothetical protein
MNTIDNAIAAGFDNDDCRPPDAPFSLDPAVWAKAFLFSGDWRDPERVALWFYNAMRAAGLPEESDPFEDYGRHAKPPSA